MDHVGRGEKGLGSLMGVVVQGPLGRKLAFVTK